MPTAGDRADQTRRVAALGRRTGKFHVDGGLSTGRSLRGFATRPGKSHACCVRDRSPNCDLRNTQARQSYQDGHGPVRCSRWRAQMVLAPERRPRCHARPTRAWRWLRRSGRHSQRSGRRWRATADRGFHAVVQLSAGGQIPEHLWRSPADLLFAGSPDGSGGRDCCPRIFRMRSVDMRNIGFSSSVHPSRRCGLDQPTVGYSSAAVPERRSTGSCLWR